MEAPVINLVTADATTGTVTVDFSSDPLFPAATTTFYLLDPITKAVVLVVPGQTPIAATLGPAIPVNAPYEISAITYDVATLTFSPPAVAFSLLASGWDSTPKTIVVCDAVQNADFYRLYATTPPLTAAVLVDTSDVHWAMDSTVYVDEDEAASVTYRMVAVIGGNEGAGRVVSRTRTTARMCLVTGSMTQVDAGVWVDTVVLIKPRFTAVRQTLQQLRVPEFVQGRHLTHEPLAVFANAAGKWGCYLLQGANVDIEIPLAYLRAEFTVPNTSTADLSAIPLVQRPYMPDIA